jgi:hypothetical protein
VHTFGPFCPWLRAFVFAFTISTMAYGLGATLSTLSFGSDH